MRKLEIGPGQTKIGSDWVTVNVVRTDSTDRIADWGSNKGLPFGDSEFDLIYASHVLEHVPWYHTVRALKDAKRILKPGGIIEVWVPNFGYLIECYQNKKCGDQWRKFNSENDPMMWLNGRLFTYGPGWENFHRAAFDEPFLKQQLGKAGFKDIKRLKKPRGDDHGRINLGMSGTK